jgi:hypothetical protein
MSDGDSAGRGAHVSRLSAPQRGAAIWLTSSSVGVKLFKGEDDY